jgi:hypothetical protein
VFGITEKRKNGIIKPLKNNELHCFWY